MFGYIEADPRDDSPVELIDPYVFIRVVSGRRQNCDLKTGVASLEEVRYEPCDVIGQKMIQGFITEPWIVCYPTTDYSSCIMIKHNPMIEERF